jgi:hypothetical protein
MPCRRSVCGVSTPLFLCFAFPIAGIGLCPSTAAACQSGQLEFSGSVGGESMQTRSFRWSRVSNSQVRLSWLSGRPRSRALICADRSASRFSSDNMRHSLQARRGQAPARDASAVVLLEVPVRKVRSTSIPIVSRVARALVRASMLGGLCLLAAEAQAQPVPCPSGTGTQTFYGEFSAGGGQREEPLTPALSPCETILGVLTVSDGGNGPSGIYVKLEFRNAAHATIDFNDASCQGCTIQTPRASIAPLRSTRGPEALPVYVRWNVGSNLSNVAYTLTLYRNPRPGYNTGGLSLADAPLLLPQLGGIHASFDVDEIAGQYFRVRLAANGALTVSGTGQPTTANSSGSSFVAKLYNSAGQEVASRTFAIMPPTTNFSRLLFTNASSVPGEFYLRIYCRFQDLFNLEMTVSGTVTPAVSGQLSELGFIGDHPLSLWNGKRPVDQPDGHEPTWRLNGGAAFPAAYTRGTRPTLFGRLTLSDSLAGTVLVRAKNEANVVIASASVSADGSNSLRVPHRPVLVDLENDLAVKKSSYSWSWEFSLDGGASWLGAGSSGPQPVFWTYAQPAQLPFANTIPGEVPDGVNVLYDLALDWATRAAAGVSEPESIRVRTARLLKEELFYDPAQRDGGHPLERIIEGHAQCDELAHLMRGLLRSIGIDADVRYLWGGTAAGPSWFAHSSPRETVTFRVLSPAEDDAGANPHFSFHAIVVSADEGVHDPSYGVSRYTIADLTPFDEVADGGTFLVAASALTRQVVSYSLQGLGAIPRPASTDLLCQHDRPQDMASFVRINVPATMMAGQQYAATITYRNSGVTTWTASGGYFVHATAVSSPEWRTVNAPVPSSVAPNQQVTIPFNITAPTQPGTYNLQLIMVWLVAPFGVESNVALVNVVP